MESLPIGTTTFRSFDEQTYVKASFSNDLKRPCIWRSPSGHPLFISDVSIQTNTKQFSDIKKP